MTKLTKSLHTWKTTAGIHLDIICRPKTKTGFCPPTSELENLIHLRRTRVSQAKRSGSDCIDGMYMKPGAEPPTALPSQKRLVKNVSMDAVLSKAAGILKYDMNLCRGSARISKRQPKKLSSIFYYSSDTLPYNPSAYSY